MKAYFAVGDGVTAIRFLRGRRTLVSFAYFGTRWLPTKHLATLSEGASEFMVDSGAFTAWKQGKPIEYDAYVGWLTTTNVRFDTAIALDVIGDPDASVANWERMRGDLPHVRLMPVWHEGDPLEHLDHYVENAPIVGLGRMEARRSDVKTYDFYDSAFNRQPDGAFHGLGNANPVQLEPYPFESFDSTGWQRDAAYSNAAKWPFNRCSRDTRMIAFIEATETLGHRPTQHVRMAYEQRSSAAKKLNGTAPHEESACDPL